jgi:hypothetical protein
MYKLVGADRREYGPVSQEAVLEWIAQGRANAQTIARFEDGAWKPLGTFEEFKSALGIASAPPVMSGDVTVIAPAAGASEPLPFSGVNSQRKSNVAAILGLVFSVICCCCTFAGPALGIVFSVIGIVQIRNAPGRYSTSVYVGYAGIAISVVILILHIIATMLDAQLSKHFRVPLGF